MRFGLALPHYDYSFPNGLAPVRFDAVAAIARRADELGFHSVWISDHFFLDLDKYGAGDSPQGSLEPFTALAGLASVTERVRLGTLVASAPFRHPSVVANMAASIDGFSAGRFDLGVGAGWYEAEFSAFGYHFPATGDRFAMLEDHLQVLRALVDAGEQPVDVANAHYRLSGALLAPAPVQTPLPIWLGAKGGPRSLALAARYADGWNTAWRWTPETYAPRARAADEACEKIGRDPASLHRSVGLNFLIGTDDKDLRARYERLQRWTPGGAFDAVGLEEFARDAAAGTPERLRELAARFAELGVEEIIFNAGTMPFVVSDLDQIELVAAGLIEV